MRNESYGNYGHAYRSNRNRHNVGGTIAMILAMLFILSAGVLIGRTYGGFSPIGGNSSSTVSSQDAASSQAEPEDPGFTVPAGITAVKQEETTSGSFSAIPLDQVASPSYIVIDRMTGAVLLQKESESRIYPGSTTKMMTAALALELGNMDDVLTANSFALGLTGTTSTTVGLVDGEQTSLRNLLYALMLPSACDAANVIADQSSLGYNNFVSTMVSRAKEIGCTGTYFVNPSGIYSNVHYSTVSDIARIAAYAALNPAYRQIVSTQSYVFPATNAHNGGWTVMKNTNPLLGMEKQLFPDGKIVRIDGAKTGTTFDGGYSLVCTAVTSNGTQLAAVISGIPYDSGNGSYVRVPDMVAILNTAAEVANASAAKVYVEADKALSAELDGGVGAALPFKLKLVPERGFAVSVTENMLQNGTTAIFGGTEGYTVQAYYFDTLKTAVDTFTPGDEVTVGYLKITTADGKEPVDTIPLILKEK